MSAETVRITHDGPATTAMAGPIVLNGRDGAKPSISPAELGGTRVRGRRQGRIVAEARSQGRGQVFQPGSGEHGA